MASPLFPPLTDTRFHRWRRSYARLLLVELLFLALQWAIRIYFPSEHQAGRPHLALAELASFWWTAFLLQHLVLLGLATPTVAAASIAAEKGSGTLTLLLTTPATSWDIVAGKFLGLSGGVLTLSLPVVPLLAMTAALLDLPFILPCLILLESCILVFLIAALSLAVSCLARRSEPAQASALCLTLVLLVVQPVPLPLADFTRTMLDGGGFSQAFAGGFPWLLVWLGTILVCLMLATWQLRPAHARFLENADRPRTLVLRGRRPPVTDQPLRWKERWTVERSLARWFTGKQVAAAAFFLAGGLGWALPDEQDATMAHALIFMFLPAFILQGKNAGTICRERENGTWDLLRITHLTPRNIVRGKLWGYLDGFKRPMTAYLAGFVCGAVGSGNLRGLVCFPIAWLLTWGLLYYMGAVGIYCSARSSTTRQAALRAVAHFFGDLFTALLPSALVTILVGTCCNPLIGSWGLRVYSSILVLAFFLPLVVFLFGYAEKHLQETQGLLALEGNETPKPIREIIPTRKTPPKPSIWFQLGGLFAKRK